jgi:cytochrome c oxidase subunit 1
MTAWFTGTDHKKIGMLYMSTTLLFLTIAGLLGTAIRTQLARPGERLIDPHAYAAIFTLHGTAMIFLAIAPFALGLANYLVPLQIGAPDMAFPRLNATSYWAFLFGGLIVFAGAATNEGAAASGWSAYAPLSTITVASGLGQDFWIVGIAMVSAASIATAVNLVTTTFIYRAPGMTMWRIPIFTWEMIATSLLIFMAFPSLMAALVLLFVDRHLGGHVFDPTYGGSAILYEHLFWFFGHPEVYVLILPYFGIISEVVSTFSGRPVFGYTGMVLSAFAIAGLSMGVWAHHMFTTGAVNNPFFSFVSFLIAVPTGIKFFNWICTMWGGAIRFTTAMLFALGFLLNFLIGGVTGVMVASPPVDFHAHDSYFVIAHFHYVIGGGSMFALFAALYYWWPKFFGWRLDERLGQVNFWLTFVGFNVTFMPMFFAGMIGMPRRVETYDADPLLAQLNLVATAGAYLLVLASAVFVANVALAARRRAPAGANPWDGGTLEWATSSPPPEHNFHALPPIRSARPLRAST